MTPAEFVGGPLDGLQRILHGEPEAFSVDGQVSDGRRLEWVYARRRISGETFRRDGIVMFDFICVAECNRSSE